MPAEYEWPPEIQDAIRDHVQRAVERLDPERYAQEPAYVAGLMARLDGVAYHGDHGRVEFTSTIVTDRGPGAAEKKWGADFAVTAELEQHGRASHKAVFGQAKLGSIDELTKAGDRWLREQCGKMARATQDLVVLEVPRCLGDSPMVRVVRASPRPATAPESAGIEYETLLSLADYFVERLLPCHHGDRRGAFLQAVKRSRLTQLHLAAEAW